jgi:hypothetical protein
MTAFSVSDSKRIITRGRVEINIIFYEYILFQIAKRGLQRYRSGCSVFSLIWTKVYIRHRCAKGIQPPAAPRPELQIPSSATSSLPAPYHYYLGLGILSWYWY